MKRVLLIDDDPICNFINRRVIETTGLAKEIMVAENGRQGLELLIKCSKNGDPFPDLIVLDINMPILNGFEFLMYLRQLEISGFQNSHITILSSSDSLADKMKAKEFGIENYLLKPITREAMTRLLQ